MAITREQAMAELERRQAAKEELARRGAVSRGTTKPSVLGAVGGMTNFNDPRKAIQESIGLGETDPIQAALAPFLAPAKVGNLINQGSEQLGVDVTEELGRRQVPAPISATAGLATELLANPLSYIGGTSSKAGRLLKPVVPAERMALVKSAEELGVPLTRAEMTGGKTASSIESFLEKTPFGASPIENFRAAQKSTIDKALEAAQERLGSRSSPKVAGMKSQDKLIQNTSKNKSTINSLYSKIDENVKITTNNLKEASRKLLGKEEIKPTSFQSALTQKIKELSDINRTDFKSLKDIRSDLSDIVSANDAGLKTGMGLQSTRDAGTAKLLIKKIDKDIDNFASQTENAAFKKDLTAAQSFYKDAKQLANSKIVKQINKASPENVPEIIFSQGRESDVNVAKAALGTEGFNEAKKQFVNEIISSNKIKQFFSKNDDSFIKSVFNSEEIKTLKNLQNVKEIALTAEKQAPSTGSARANMVAAALGGGGVGVATGNPLTGLLTSVGGLAAPYGASKILMSEAVRKGIPYSVSKGTMQAGKAATNYLAEALNRKKKK